MDYASKLLDMSQYHLQQTPASKNTGYKNLSINGDHLKHYDAQLVYNSGEAERHLYTKPKVKFRFWLYLGTLEIDNRQLICN